MYVVFLVECYQVKGALENSQHCHDDRGDWIFRIAVSGVVVLCVLHLLPANLWDRWSWLAELSHAVYDLISVMWWGIVFGIVSITVLGRIPREFVMSALGGDHGLSAILRATLAGVLLDLCSHGVLMVAAKLYERGASAGQVVAFLLASPWNSFSFTLILIALVGLAWTALFVVLSLLVALITGYLFDRATVTGVLSANPHAVEVDDQFQFWPQARAGLRGVRLSPAGVFAALADGLHESRMVVKWLMVGVLLASAVRVFVSPEQFGAVFGPTLLGLGASVVLATVLEVCSEGSAPIAADLYNRAGAPGNAFAFLMGGVATDYTEIMTLREAMHSWRAALLLPALTVPQVLLLGWLLNAASL